MKKLISLLLVFTVLISLCSCTASDSKQRFKKSFLDVFDTASTVIAYDTSNEEFEKNFEIFHNELLRYDHLYDIYNSYDGIVNLNTVNNTAMDAPVKVDNDIIELLEYCKQVYEISEGRTNVCLGAVLYEWHKCRSYGIENPSEAQLPDIKLLEEKSKHTSIDDLIINKEEGTVYFADKQLRLDVGAIAKGYAVSKACALAENTLWSAAAISIGGNVYTYGYKNDDGKTLWSIGIDNPDTLSDDYLCMLDITNESIVTSGDYQRFYTVDGKKYCHIIDPKTLMPSEYFSGVTVICRDSAMGDALSTTLFNMTLDEGMALVEGMDNVEAVWVDKEYNRTFSSGFEQYIKE